MNHRPLLRNTPRRLIALACMAAAFLSALTLPAAQTSYIEGEVLVTFKPTSSLIFAQATLSRKSLSLTRHFGALSARQKKHVGLIRDHSKTTAELIASLQNDPSVEVVEPNYLRWFNAAPNDTRFPEMWGLNNTGQTVAGNSGTASADVKFIDAIAMARPSPTEIVVAVIDSGVDWIHPELAPNMWINSLEIPRNGIDDDSNGYVDDYHGFDFTEDDDDPSDSGEHGTHVAGTIAAVGNNQTGVIGVDDKAHIMALKVSSNGISISTSAVIEALQYLVAMKTRGVNVVAINGSYGGGSASISERNAILAAGDAGIIFCSSAGNETTDNDVISSYPANYRLSNMIVVASSDQDDALSDFSNYGAATVDLAAPGSNILSTRPSTVTFSAGGTNYACSEMTFSGRTPGLSGNLVFCGIGDTGQFPAAVNGNIALIERGTLNFSVKSANAKAAGAKAAIIYNNVSGGYLGTLGSQSNWIPTLSITQADGLAIKAGLPKIGTLGAAPAYQFLDGTSMATPHVTGAVALAAKNFPEESVAQRRSRILDNVDLKPAFENTTITGGRLNLKRTVDVNGNNIADWFESAPLFVQYLYSHGLGASTGLADSDFDGVPNALEFVLGRDPTTSDTTIQPTASFTTSGGNAFVFSFQVTSHPGNVTWLVETSPDLSTWTSAVHGVNGVTITSTPINADSNLITVSVPTITAKLFGRLSVSGF